MATFPNVTEGASAPSNVVPIRAGIRVNRKPHENDINTSVIANCYRQAVAKTHDLADQPEMAWQAALEAAKLRSAIPALNLRCIHGTRDIRADYDLRLAEMEAAKANAEAHSAAMHVWRRREAGEQGKDFLCVKWPEEMVWRQHQLWSLYQRATLDFARSQSPTIRALADKRKRIGSVWLRAEGDFYDKLRDALAEDETRLADRRRVG